MGSPVRDQKSTTYKSALYLQEDIPSPQTAAVCSAATWLTLSEPENLLLKYLKNSQVADIIDRHSLLTVQTLSSVFHCLTMVKKKPP